MTSKKLHPNGPRLAFGVYTDGNLNPSATLGTILVVEDDPDTAMLMRDLLRASGFDVEAVHSAAECIDSLRGRPVDVVVTDVEMTGMSGLDLCALLRPTYPSLLFVIVTGGGGLDRAMAAIRAGAYDYITKPVRGPALRLAVSRAMDHLAQQRKAKRSART